MTNIPSQSWFDEAFSSEDYPHTTCLHCLKTEYTKETEEHYHCPICLSDDLNYNSIPLHIFISNIENIVKESSPTELSEYLEDFNSVTYECPECSSIEDDQYFCTSCENTTFTVVDYILRVLIDNNNTSMVEAINNARE